MVGVIFVYVDTVYWFYEYFFMLNWMFQHDYLDTYCFECLICMRFVFLYLHLFSSVDIFHMQRCSRHTLIIIIIFASGAGDLGFNPVFCGRAIPVTLAV